MRILHCVRDEKFIDDTIDVCESIVNNHEHTFVIFSNSIKAKFKYIKKVYKIRCCLSSDFLEYVNCNFDVVIIHSLASVPFDKIRKIKNNIKVVWISWGFDLYTFPHPELSFIKIPLYHEETKKLVKPSLKLYLQQKHALFHTLFNLSVIRKNISRIDFFSGILPEEYELMKRSSFFNAKRVQWHYTSMYTYTYEQIECHDNNILIGNSADPSNNHVDIFKAIKPFVHKNLKVIVPLSYGGNSNYRKKVTALGDKLFGNQFVPILDFIPIEKYLRLISSCRNVIMGHERQQAIGNINESLRFGCRLFLFKSSMNFKHYSSLGFKIYTIEDDLRLLSEVIDKEICTENICLMEKKKSNEVYWNSIREMFNEITK